MLERELDGHAISWQPYIGQYEKIWYDARTPDGTIYPFCWPNAGLLCPIFKSKNGPFRPREVEYRPSGANPAFKAERDAHLEQCRLEGQTP